MNLVVEPIVMDVHLPPGMAGPDPLDFDVRCFVVQWADGIVLIDTGLAGSHDLIGAALEQVDARWSDVTDVVLTHGHPDHVGGLGEVLARAPHADVWAGGSDQDQIPFAGPFRTLADGGRVRDLRVIATPGHTPGHVSFLHEPGSTLFSGDVVGTTGGLLSRGPAAFTADPEQAERSLEQVATLRFERALFSHGPEIAEPLVALHRLLHGA